jgi:hypothetical protein
MHEKFGAGERKLACKKESHESRAKTKRDDYTKGARSELHQLARWPAVKRTFRKLNESASDQPEGGERNDVREYTSDQGTFRLFDHLISPLKISPKNGDDWLCGGKHNRCDRLAAVHRIGVVTTERVLNRNVLFLEIAKNGVFLRGGKETFENEAGDSNWKPVDTVDHFELVSGLIAHIASDVRRECRSASTPLASIAKNFFALPPRSGRHHALVGQTIQRRVDSSERDRTLEPFLQFRPNVDAVSVGSVTQNCQHHGTFELAQRPDVF